VKRKGKGRKRHSRSNIIKRAVGVRRNIRCPCKVGVRKSTKKSPTAVELQYGTPNKGRDNAEKSLRFRGKIEGESPNRQEPVRRSGQGTFIRIVIKKFLVLVSHPGDEDKPKKEQGKKSKAPETSKQRLGKKRCICGEKETWLSEKNEVFALCLGLVGGGLDGSSEKSVKSE